MRADEILKPGNDSVTVGFQPFYIGFNTFQTLKYSQLAWPCVFILKKRLHLEKKKIKILGKSH